jgi:hypothetical protein
MRTLPNPNPKRQRAGIGANDANSRTAPPNPNPKRQRAGIFPAGSNLRESHHEIAVD